MQILLWRLHAKSIRDQITEGLHDGDIVEDLLQESDLTLVKEAAKKNWSQIVVQEQETDMVAHSIAY